MKIFTGYSDTRSNNEDFAITPYISSILVNTDIKVIGIGLCWGYFSIFIAIGKNLPKGYPFFKIHK